MKRFKFTLIILFLAALNVTANPIINLLERIDPGSSSKFQTEIIKSQNDFFELDQKGPKVVIRGNNYVSIATGLNWYLKYYAHIHLSWNQMTAKLPATLPAVTQKERHETNLPYRYDLNYCTHSYSMAFWDWDRWQKEIDWMALHGINLPLDIVGTDAVWYRVLAKLGYSKKEINDFIAGPGFQAWWLMNNLEGWGGPNPDSWYPARIALQQKIVKRMREYGIEPVFPGYVGMVPNNAKAKLGLNVSDPGNWCGFRRPAFLQPSDPHFARIAALYYKEMTNLFGKANFYSMDPFHEGGNTAGVDLDAAGKAIMQAMKQCNPHAVWVIQAWAANPRHDMIKNLKAGDLLVLDLQAESRPQWGDPGSVWYREKGFEQHNWIFCMLLNYGAKVGLNGTIKQLLDNFYRARESKFNTTLKGVGMAMEGIENNPLMYELLTELPWYEKKIDQDQWLDRYTVARYGQENKDIEQAWHLLANGIYACPGFSKGNEKGGAESVFCARPSEDPWHVSTWAEPSDYYNPDDVIRAAGLMVKAAPIFKNSNNFAYDLTDIVRQAVCDRGRQIQKIVAAAYAARDLQLYEAASKRFLQLILLQDQLLSTRSEFCLGTWLEAAKRMGKTEEEKKLYEWNARTLITTWGPREAAGGLHDYAHREWNGMLKDFYYPRWKAYFEYRIAQLKGEKPQAIDFYAMEEQWTKQRNLFSVSTNDCITNVIDVYNKVFHEN